MGRLLYYKIWGLTLLFGHKLDFQQTNIAGANDWSTSRRALSEIKHLRELRSTESQA